MAKSRKPLVSERSAIASGKKRAAEAVGRRKAAVAPRLAAVARAQKADVAKGKTLASIAGVTPIVAMAQSVGTLIAEGDSWFDYPFVDVLKSLDDRHGFEIESVAHRGDSVEAMAYNGQLDDFSRRIEKVLRRGVVPRAILLSGGGNDVAGDQFQMLLNHSLSPTRGLNERVVEGIIDDRVRLAYVTILSAITALCESLANATIPILLHGYDYPVPDGRGFWGGWWFLPGPWLKPGFDLKGYGDLKENIGICKDLIDRLNAMIRSVTALPQFPHVKFIDLRGTLSNRASDYEDWWDNEMHPTRKGFEAVADQFAAEIP